MDVKAEVVLLIFTLNCVTLVLLGHDLIQYRLCQERFADYPVCISTEITTTTTSDPIIMNNDTTTTTTTTTTVETTTTTSFTTFTTTTISNSTAPTSTIITNLTTTTTFPMSPTLRSSPPPPPPVHHHHQQHAHQLLSPPPPPLPINERYIAPLTPASPPPSPGFADANFSSGRYGGGADSDADEEDDLTKEVNTCGLIIIATYIGTSIASSQVLGRWIDRWSCRTTTMFPLTGVVAWAVCGLLVSAAPSIPLYLWLVGAALGGSSGGFVTLKAAATTYAVQASPRWDNTVRLALLQAATSVGVLLAYITFYFLRTDPYVSFTSIFIGITVLGIVNIFFVFIFLSDKPPTTPVTASASTTTTVPPGNSPNTQIITYNSSSSLDRYTPREEDGGGDEEEREKDEDDSEDGNVTGEKDNVGKKGKCQEEVLTEPGQEKDDDCDGKEKENNEKEATYSKKTTQNDDSVETRMHSSFPIDIVVTPPEGGRHEKNKDAEESTQRSKRRRKLGIIHNFNFVNLTPHDEEDEGSWETWHKRVNTPDDYGSSHCCLQSPLPIIINFEDGSSVYGTPPEPYNLPASRYGTPPSRALSSYVSCTSLEMATAASASDQQCGLSTHQQQPEASAKAYSYDYRPYYENPQLQITGLSSSAPSTFLSLMEARNDGAHYFPVNKTQTVHKLKLSDSQNDMLTTPNVQLIPASSLGSVLVSEGSNRSSSSSSGEESRDVMQKDERDILYDCASLGDMQEMSLPSTDIANSLSSSNDSTSIRQAGSMLTIQQSGSMVVSEREGRGPLAPLTVAGESSGDGVRCAGGGGAGRCLACVVGRLLCRPVSVTFRRRAAGLRGIVVADVVAAFLTSVVAAGVWKIAPLYLEVKMGWSLADWVPYLACRSSLRVLALVLLLPLLRQRLSLQDTTLGVIGGLSSLLSSFCLSFLWSSMAAIGLGLIFGSLTLYLNVASAAILVRLVGVTELGGVLLWLGSIEQAGQLTGWLTFHYLFPLLLRHCMPGVVYLATGLLLLVPSAIFGVLYFSLGLRSNRFGTPGGTPRSTPSPLTPRPNTGELQTPSRS